MIDLIVAAVLILAIGSASLYLRKAKKNGVKCVGCPSGGSCGGCGCQGESGKHKR